MPAAFTPPTATAQSPRRAPAGPRSAPARAGNAHPEARSPWRDPRRVHRRGGGHPLRWKELHGALRGRDGSGEGPRSHEQDAEGLRLRGLSKPPRQPSDPLVAIERAWERYHGNFEALVKEGVTERPGSRVRRCPRINRASGRKEREGPGCNPGPHKYRPAEGPYARSLADPEAVVQFLSIRAAGWTPSFSTS